MLDPQVDVDQMPGLDANVRPWFPVPRLGQRAAVHGGAGVPLPGTRQPPPAELLVNELGYLQLAYPWTDLIGDEADDRFGCGDRCADALDLSWSFASAQA